MVLYVIYQILCLSIILCDGTLVHKPGSCQIDSCEQERHIAALEQRILALEGKQTSYAFMAQAHRLLAHPMVGHSIVFENVITNVGGAYNKHNGTFVVPLCGTYAFSYHLNVRRLPGQVIRAYLKQNNRIIGRALCNEDDNFEMCGDQVVVHGNAGDNIHINLSIAENNFNRSGNMNAHFQGFLIRQD